MELVCWLNLFLLVILVPLSIAQFVGMRRQTKLRAEDMIWLRRVLVPVVQQGLALEEETAVRFMAHEVLLAGHDGHLGTHDRALAEIAGALRTAAGVSETTPVASALYPAFTPEETEAELGADTLKRVDAFAAKHGLTHDEALAFCRKQGEDLDAQTWLAGQEPAHAPPPAPTPEAAPRSDDRDSDEEITRTMLRADLASVPRPPTHDRATPTQLSAGVLAPLPRVGDVVALRVTARARSEGGTVVVRFACFGFTHGFVTRSENVDERTGTVRAIVQGIEPDGVILEVPDVIKPRRVLVPPALIAGPWAPRG